MKRSAMPRPSKPIERRVSLRSMQPPNSMSARTPLRRESTKRRAQRAEYDAMKAEVRERDNYTCQARELVPSVRCWGVLDPQHVIPQSVWKGGRMKAANVLSVCRGHHEWIGANPTEAHRLKLHGYSWEAESA